MHRGKCTTDQKYSSGRSTYFFDWELHPPSLSGERTFRNGIHTRIAYWRAMPPRSKCRWTSRKTDIGFSRKTAIRIPIWMNRIPIPPTRIHDRPVDGYNSTPRAEAWNTVAIYRTNGRNRGPSRRIRIPTIGTEIKTRCATGTNCRPYL